MKLPKRCIVAMCIVCDRASGFLALAPRSGLHVPPPKIGTAARTLGALRGGDPFSKQAFLRKPEFDLLSLRQFRRETLLVYNGANQSEPLRIALAALASFFFALVCLLSVQAIYLSSMRRTGQKGRAGVG